MKTRMGFVSNSSTTSFCIYGVNIQEHNIIPLLRKSYKNNPDFWKIMDSFITKSSNSYERNLLLELKTIISGKGDCIFNSESICLFFEEMGLKGFHDYENSSLYIGDKATSKKKEETLAQFGEKIEKKISDIFGGNISCEFFEETISS